MTESVITPGHLYENRLTFEQELGAIFMDYTVQSSRILRDSQNNSRGVGFARLVLLTSLASE
jgi:hypothetical protein